MQNPKFYLSTIALLSASACFVSADFHDAAKRQTSLEWCSKFEAFEQEFLNVLDNTGFEFSDASLFPQALKDQCNQAKDLDGLSSTLYSIMTELEQMGTWVFESFFPIFYKIYHPNGETKNNHTECAAYFDQKYNQVSTTLAGLAYYDTGLNALLQTLVNKMDNATVDLTNENTDVVREQLEARRLALYAGTATVYSYLQGSDLETLLGTSTPATEIPSDSSTETSVATDETTDSTPAAEPTTTTNTEAVASETPATDDSAPSTDDSTSAPSGEAKTVTPMSSAKSDSTEDEYNYDTVADSTPTEEVAATPTTETQTPENQTEDTEAKTDL